MSDQLKANGADLTAQDRANFLDGLGLSSVFTIDPETGAAGLNPDAVAGALEPATSTLTPIDGNLSELAALVAETPFGNQSYVAGVLTQTNNSVPIVGTGSSVGRGEGARHPSDPAGNSDWAPSVRFGAILAEELEMVGKYTITVDNKSVNGSFDNDVPTQFASRSVGFTSGHIHLLTPGMNAATPFGLFYAATFPGQIDGLRAACNESIAAGYVPILQTTMHPHPLLAWQDAGSATGGNLTQWIWPTPTLDVTLDTAVDSTARTISRSYLTTYGPFGGTKIKVGSTLRFSDGPNSGVDLLVSAIGSDVVTIAAGPTLTSETSVSRRLYHVASADENETLLPLPPSKRYVRANRSGSGETMGIRLFDLYNAAIVNLAKELRVPLILIDQMSFDFVVANGGDSLAWNESTKTMTGSAPGWDAGYTTSYAGQPDVQQHNHPNIAHRTATFDLGARKLARLIRRGELTRDSVIR